MAKKQFDPNNRQGVLILMEDIIRIRKMKKNDRLALIDAIFTYACGENPHEEKLPYAVALVYPDVRDRVDRMEARYQIKRHAGRSNNKTGADVEQNESTDGADAEQNESIDGALNTNTTILNTETNSLTSKTYPLTESVRKKWGEGLCVKWEKYLRVREQDGLEVDQVTLTRMLADLSVNSGGDPTVAAKILDRCAKNRYTWVFKPKQFDQEEKRSALDLLMSEAKEDADE